MEGPGLIDGMRLWLTLTAAIVAGACGRQTAVSSPAPATAPPQCTYEIVHPDTTAASAAFLAWLKPQAEELFGDTSAFGSGKVFIADFNNDGTNEFLFALHEGSGSYLNAMVFRRDGEHFSIVEHPPFEDRLTGSHEYAGAFLTEPQLVVRLCGKTIINFSAGTEPNYYPDGVMWEGTAARRVCSGPWLAHHRSVAADLLERGMFDEARVLLAGVRSGCEAESPGDVRAITDDLERIAQATANASASTYDFSWLVTEIKTNPDSQLVRDQRFSAMLVAIVPDAQLEHESLRGALKKSLWLPDDARLIDDRYVVIAGCEPHNCPNRGFVWIDTGAKQAIAMTGGVLASRTIPAPNIPAMFWRHTVELLHPAADETIDFVGADGKTVKVKVP